MRRFLTLFVMLMLGGVLAFSQTRVVTGKVTDSTGNSVGNASIKIKGAKSGVSANANGVFKISAPEGAVLVISAVGYGTKEVAASDNLTILLGADVGRLSEVVVVTAAGIRRTEKTIGYAVSKVDPATLLQKSEPDMLKSLQGKVAGVDIRTSQGTPGAATRIQIRGNSSFFGNNQPLIIVDGIPYSNDQITTSSQVSGGTAYSSGISNLDPNDIASMSVLKGSSAGALYGSRASNGVIIITTKSGSASRSKKGSEVSVKSSVSFENIANLPDYQNKYGTGANFGYSNSNGSWGPLFGFDPNKATYSRDSIPAWPDYKAAYPELFPTANIKYKAVPDNVSNLFRTGVVYENSLGFNGGDEKSAFALTASQLNHSGYVPYSSYNRSNVGVGGSTKLNIGLNIRGNFSYTRSVQNGGYFGENQVDGAASQFARSLFLGRTWDTHLPFETKLGNNVTWNGGDQFDNPQWSSKYNTARTAEERTIATIHADFNLNKWIRVDYSIGSNVNTVARDEVTEISSRAASKLGRLVKDNYRKQEIESNLLVTFTPSIGNDFTLKTTLGTSFNQRSSSETQVTGNQFIVRGVHTLNNTIQQTFDFDGTFRRRLLGVFGDVTLGYKNYAFITGTARNDWSSTLPQSNRSYLYPSISGSLIFSDALKINNNILDYGKLRAGWAKVGRDASEYQLEDYFNLGTAFLGQSTGSLPGTSNNPLLKPEFTRELEIGTQLSFLKKRIELDFTWYDKKSTNLIAAISTPASSGYSQQVTNFGGISNKGVEIELTVRPVRTKSFSWEVKGIFTKNTNLVTELLPGLQRILLGGVLTSISPYLEAGKPYGYLRGSKSLRDSATGQLLINPATGGMIQAPDNGEVGNPNPDYKMGITNNFSYKGFLLSVLFDMTQGGDLYSVTTSSLLGRGVIEATQDRETSWLIPGIYGDPATGKATLVGGKTVANHTRITTNDLYFSPNPTSGQTFAINTATEWNIYDATVYRLREVSIGYEIPKSVFKKLPIGSMSLSVTGRNLWFLAPNFPKSANIDPEVNSFGSTNIQGIELSAAPTTKRIGVNLHVTF